jgi:predicted Zn-dependent protease
MIRQLLLSVLSLCLVVTIVGCATKATDDDAQAFRKRWSELYTPSFEAADVEAEVRFGREVAARLLGERDGVENEALQQYVNTLGRYLAQFGGRDDIDFYFRVIESDVVNAYAMPGGYIFLTSEALSLMTNEAQLAGVLAHEIAHVSEKHVVKALNIKSAGGATLVQLTSGANDAFRVALEQAADQALTLLTESGLQHQDEYDADELGMFIMVQAGYDPTEYVQYMSVVASANKSLLSEMSHTHPPMSSRLTQLENALKSNNLENLNYAVMESRFLNNVP